MDNLLKEPPGDQNEKKETFREEEATKNFPQYLAAATANIVLMIAGTVLGWTSPILPKLMVENSTLPVTEDESTWIGSLVAIGAIFGPFPAGICADHIGRKNALLAAAVPFLISWCFLAAARSVGMIYVGRVLAGIANGWGMTLIPMYIGEIATPDARGALVVLGQIMITLGFLLIYVIGPVASYFWVNVSCGIIPLIFLISFAFMPESPHFLLSKNNKAAASDSLQRLRGKSEEGVREELNTLQGVVDEAMRNTGTWMDLFTKRANKKAVFLLFGLMAIQQFSGVNVVLFYSENIFQKAGSSLSPSVCTIIVGFVMFVASFPTPYLIERLGRRIVLLVSSLGMMICQGVIGCVFYLERLHYDVTSIGWLPLASIIGYISFYSAGLGPVPWGMIGEMFASSVRAKGAAFTAGSSWFMAFIMTKSFGTIVDGLGAHSAFWIFSVCCGLGGVFVYLLLPETKGKTLEEIQQVLNEK